MSSIEETTEHNDSELLEGKESSDCKNDSPRNVADKTTAIREIYKKTSANVIGFIKHEDDPFWTERKGTFGQKFSSPSQYEKVESKLFKPTVASIEGSRQKFTGVASPVNCSSPEPTAIISTDVAERVLRHGQLLQNQLNMDSEELAKLSNDDSWKRGFDRMPTPPPKQPLSPRGAMSVAERTTTARECDRRKREEEPPVVPNHATAPPTFKLLDVSSRLLTPTSATTRGHKSKYEVEASAPVKTTTIINPSANFLKPTCATNKQKWSVEKEKEKERSDEISRDAEHPVNLMSITSIDPTANFLKPTSAAIHQKWSADKERIDESSPERIATPREGRQNLLSPREERPKSMTPRADRQSMISPREERPKSMTPRADRQSMISPREERPKSMTPRADRQSMISPREGNRKSFTSPTEDEHAIPTFKLLDMSSRLLTPTVATANSHKPKYEAAEASAPVKTVSTINPSANFLKPTSAATHQKWSVEKERVEELTKDVEPPLSSKTITSIDPTANFLKPTSAAIHQKWSADKERIDESSPEKIATPREGRQSMLSPREERPKSMTPRGEMSSMISPREGNRRSFTSATEDDKAIPTFKLLDMSSRLLTPTMATANSHKPKYEASSSTEASAPVKTVTTINPSANFLKPTSAATHQKWSVEKERVEELTRDVEPAIHADLKRDHSTPLSPVPERSRSFTSRPKSLPIGGGVASKGRETKENTRSIQELADLALNRPESASSLEGKAKKEENNDRTHSFISSIWAADSESPVAIDMSETDDLDTADLRGEKGYPHLASASVALTSPISTSAVHTPPQSPLGQTVDPAN